MHTDRGWFRSSGSDDDVAVSSRVRLARNLIGIPFPPTLSKEEEQQVQRMNGRTERTKRRDPADHHQQKRDAGEGRQHCQHESADVGLEGEGVAERPSENQ